MSAKKGPGSLVAAPQIEWSELVVCRRDKAERKSRARRSGHPRLPEECECWPASSPSPGSQRRQNKEPLACVSPPPPPPLPSFPPSPQHSLLKSTTSIMHLRSALVAGIFALQASAFLVPLEISKAAEAAKGQIESIWSHSVHSIELDCPGCPILAPAGSETEWDEDDENRLVSRSTRTKAHGQ